jgi:hypothetical protein
MWASGAFSLLISRRSHTPVDIQTALAAGKEKETERKVEGKVKKRRCDQETVNFWS